MNRISALVLMSLLLSPAIFAEGKSRSVLDKLKKNDDYRTDDYIEPYSISQVAMKSDKDYESLTKNARAMLKKGIIPVLNLDMLPMPDEAFSEREMKGLTECKKEYCSVKLNTKKEKSELEKAKDKKKAFHDILVKRLKAYRDRREWMGFEERETNRPVLKSMLLAMPDFKDFYPNCVKYFSDDMWFKRETKGCPVVGEFLRQEIANLQSERLQPIYRFSDVIEIKGEGYTLFVEIYLYNNHYFDAGVRTYELIKSSYPEYKTAVIVTDALEIDELKKSSIIRFLYKGQMATAIAQSQTDWIESLLK